MHLKTKATKTTTNEINALGLLEIIKIKEEIIKIKEYKFRPHFAPNRYQYCLEHFKCSDC